MANREKEKISGRRAGPRLVLHQAVVSDFQTVLDLLTEASRWLRTKNTDQWAAPWPNTEDRNERIRHAIEAGRTWIARDDARPAATLTLSRENHGIWPEQMQHDPAVYVRRLAVSRGYAGLGLGGQLLDWAGIHARHGFGARWVRVDVWTTNTELHEYYLRQGFKFCGFSPLADYPSAALFQKATGQIRPPDHALFREEPKAAKAPG